MHLHVASVHRTHAVKIERQPKTECVACRVSAPEGTQSRTQSRPLKRQK